MRVSTVFAAILAAATVLAAACGDSGYGHEPAPTPTLEPPLPTATADPAASPPALPTEFRVAFINLMSPVSIDADNPVAAETFDHRLESVVEELRIFEPDIVAFTEASWTRATGSAAEYLAKALKMELQYARSNPWFPGQSREQSNATAKLIGFEEGELILSRHPILRYDRKALNPRTSETEGRAALHVVVRAPGLGEVDVYAARLTGAEDRIRQAQAASLAAFVAATRGDGPLILATDLGEAPGGAAALFTAAGMLDVAAAAATPIATCCRESVVGAQAPLAARFDYLFAEGLLSTSAAAFGTVPRTRADGLVIYPSDHNGILATFAIPAPPVP